MNQLAILEALHACSDIDRWGWTTHYFGKFVVRTDGVTGSAYNSETGRYVQLKTALLAMKAIPMRNMRDLDKL